WALTVIPPNIRLPATIGMHRPIRWWKARPISASGSSPWISWASARQIGNCRCMHICAVIGRRAGGGNRMSDMERGYGVVSKTIVEKTRETAALYFKDAAGEKPFELWKAFDKELARELSLFITGQ